ncbi:hypothetical protein ACET3Z_001795 [Daucus carota]
MSSKAKTLDPSPHPKDKKLFYKAMDVFDQTNRYDPSANMEGDPEFSGILEIYIHHARNIHNICIYDNQDVYAKFSLTYNPDEALTTKIINGGGKNPEFNESLVMKVTQLDALLKCEMWMFSRAKHYMEDQLLGFALVPVSLLVGKGKISKDFSISSTDLFHSPAGTVKLSLSLETNVSTHPTVKSFPDSAANSSITSEVLLLDRRISEVVLDPVEYSRIEFPDINVVRENQQMVTQYFSLEGHGSVSRHDLVNSGSFLRLGAPHQPVDDYEMTANSSDDNGYVSLSPNGSVQNSGFLSSTMTSLSDDRNSGDSMEKKSHLPVGLLNSPNQSITKEPTACPDTATSRKGRGIQDANIPISKDNVQESSNVKALSAPLGNINLEAEQSAMQQQIVDMYMRSMQQFSESLEKMKLPMDLNKPEPDNHGNVIQNLNNSVEVEKKKDAARVFYGSRAFF